MSMLDNFVTRSQQCRKMDLGFEKFYQSLLKTKQNKPQAPQVYKIQLKKGLKSLICCVVILPVNWCLQDEDFVAYSVLTNTQLSGFQ